MERLGTISKLLFRPACPENRVGPRWVLLQLALAYTDSVTGLPSSSRRSSRDSSEPVRDRLHVLTPIREYVQHKYPPEEADYERLRKHYLDIAIGLEFNTLLRRLTPEIHNLEAIIVYSVSIQSEQERAVRCAYALSNVLESNGIPLPLLTQNLREVLCTLRDRLSHCGGATYSWARGSASVGLRRGKRGSRGRSCSTRSSAAHRSLHTVFGTWATSLKRGSTRHRGSGPGRSYAVAV